MLLQNFQTVQGWVALYLWELFSVLRKYQMLLGGWRVAEHEKWCRDSALPCASQNGEAVVYNGIISKMSPYSTNLSPMQYWSDVSSHIVLPAVTRSTHLCANLEVSSKRNLIMDEQVLQSILNPTPAWDVLNLAGWSQASLWFAD